MRCFRHEMNIAVKGLLFGPRVAELEREEGEMTPEAKAELMKTQWRAFGALGKLHNVVKFIRHSPQRHNVFKDLQLDNLEKALVPTMDNDTRWSSVMAMIESALPQRAQIDVYCRYTNKLEDDMLTDRDWEELKEVLRLHLATDKRLLNYCCHPNI